ncbi:Predicted protein [Taphrina deformans PYCC 5710]|uniref:AB hydrolase-1 domain-containing protein n=1 Tax=Taphrina deformans (strain PYCC 5710 / ATCC 11124 / CBS 356.35 / IMI 108563 / JCM 9778 / NBRC 8474) TaxID=1097556 RepID=R4X695_TAPDE|nr:Predicted protein [Taphrina deformans PYCC 5710]|eukprot:CCG80514.1 Predicted protein [Taphrina deformans PYCC 5710]
MVRSYALVAALASLASAFVPLDPQALTPNCRQFLIPISINPMTYPLSQYIPATDFNLTNFITELSSTPNNVTMGTATQNSAAVNISARLCFPTSTNYTTRQNSTVQFLIHGIGFDMGYWDILEQPETYSYTRALNAAGYTTFAIDRLGVGNSSPGLDASNLKQTSAHIAVVNALTGQLRAGLIAGKAFANVVHVGHSYGSIISNGLVGMSPNASNGLILTGYSSSAAAVPATLAGWDLQIASLNKPDRFGAGSNSPLPNGYLLTGTIRSNQQTFFKYPQFDPLLLEYSEARKQPVTVGELITLAAGTVPTNFTGPVHVVTGANDFIFCGGDCTQPYQNYTSIPAAVKSLFPKASSFSVNLPTGTGHGRESIIL